MNAQVILGTVFAGGGAETIKAQIADPADSSLLQQEDVSEIRYWIDEVDRRDANCRNTVSGHQNVAIAAADVIFDAAQSWDHPEDTAGVGYNFVHTPDTALGDPYPAHDRTYEIRYTLTLTGGAVIKFVARVRSV